MTVFKTLKLILISLLHVLIKPVNIIHLNLFTLKHTQKKMRIHVRVVVVVKMVLFKCNSYKSLKRRPTSCKGNRKNTNTRFSRVVCLLNACIVGRPERRPKIKVICLVLTGVM